MYCPVFSYGISILVIRVGLIYIADIYRTYIRNFRSKISDIFDIFDFYRIFKNIFNVSHCDYVLIFSPCVFAGLTCALSIFSVLDNFCHIAFLHSNAV